MRTKKTRKLWAFLLLLCMIFQLSPVFRAEAAEVSEAVLNGEEHASLSLKEIFESYEHTDPEEFYQGLEELKELAAEEETAKAAKELYDKLDVAYTKAYTMWIISSTANRVDATNAEMMEESAYNTILINQMRDKFCLCIKEILDLPGVSEITAYFTEEDVEFFSTYEEMTEEQFAVVSHEEELLQEHAIKQLQANMLTVDVNGTPMGFNDIENAAALGQIDMSTYFEKHMELMDIQNALLGDVYLRLVKARQEIASLRGYDNYNDYMYESYGRDYTPEEIQEFCDSVKVYLSEPYYYLQNLIDWNAECLHLIYEPEEISEILSNYIPQTSEKLQDGLNHLLENKLYDIDYSEVKMSGAFTTYFPYFNTECIVMQPNGNTYDLLTMVHEFGHFNADYAQGSMGSLDVAEVQSQGLEMLFMEHYQDIFGKDAAIVEEYVILQMLYSFVSGCMNNELETWAYEQEDLTLEALNAKNKELLMAYEHMQENTWQLEYYSRSWVQTPHYFTSPCYYISYATSVAGAFAIRELNAKDHDAAVKAYLKVANAETDKGFFEVMEDAGLGDVLAPKTVQLVGEELMAHFDLAKRFEEKYAQPEVPEEEQNPEKEEVLEEQKSCYVRKGDTLAKIGSRFKVDWKKIAELNGIKAPYKIYAGQKLLLPENAVITSEKVTVQKGDTLGKIAASLGMNWQVLAELLGLKAPYTIYEGEVLEFAY